MHIVLINGHPQSGKSTFVELAQKNFEEVYEISTVDFVKHIAIECGWNGEKTLEARDFLADLKNLLTVAPWGDVPFVKTCDFIEDLKHECAHCHVNSDKVVVFVHVREPANIAKLKEHFCDEDVTTLYVERDVLKHIVYGNPNDSGVENYDYDVHITNNTTLADLEGLAIQFITDLRASGKTSEQVKEEFSF